MTRDGQGARDYGVHLVPATNWNLYEDCKCGAKRGEACVDRRYKRSRPMKNWTPHKRRHKGRAVISPLDGRPVVEKMEGK